MRFSYSLTQSVTADFLSFFFYFRLAFCLIIVCLVFNLLLFLLVYCFAPLDSLSLFANINVV